MSIIILGIESSCDDTSAAILKDGVILSNVIANQDVHVKYGGVVPELASRAHQQNIIPVVDSAIKEAKIKKTDIDGIAFTRGPGLLGSLLVGTSFTKGFALAQNIPMLEVNHLQGHILAHFIQQDEKNSRVPSFPFLCLLVSGGHSQIVKIKDYFDMEIIGQSIDDAAGEAFDKCAKIMGLPYPGGPMIDKYAKKGDKLAFKFTRPKVKNFDYSFSGLKTAFLYFLRKEVKQNPNFIKENLADLCASIQYTIIDILMRKLILTAKETGISTIAISGGVSANSELRETVQNIGKEKNWDVFVPEKSFTTDNAAMIAIVGHHKFLKKEFAEQNIAPLSRFKI